MADAAKAADQSMEEILQSIKRIIAEEGEPAAAASSAETPSDVLELTEMLPETPAGGDPEAHMSVESLLNSLAKPAEAAKEDEPFFDPSQLNASEAPANPSDALDALLASPPPEPSVQVAAAAPAEVASPSEGLISPSTAAASVASLKHLLEAAPTHEEPARSIAPSLPLRHGVTVEDLVVEALKPLLKEWLDGNLPQLVERIVAREVQKITASIR